MDIKDAIKKAWVQVVEKFKQDNYKKFSLYWREEVLMLYFFHFLANTGIEIREVASKEEFLFLEKGHEPDLVISVETDGKIERAVLEAKFFWATETELEKDWGRLRKFKEIFFDGGYVNYGYLLAFTSYDFQRDMQRINGYEIRSLIYKVPSNWLLGSPMDVAQRIMRKVLRKWQPEYDTDEQGYPYAFFEDYALWFWLLKDIGQMFVLIIFDEKIKPTYAKLRIEFKRRGYTDGMLERLENEGVLFLSEEPIPIKSNRYYVTKIRRLYEKFEKDYSEVRGKNQKNS